MYQVQGSNIYFVHRCAEKDLRATLDNNQLAEKACKLLNEAARLNDRRQYTASARKHAEVDAIPSIKWVV